MALKKIYFAGKRSNGERSRISSMYVDESITGVNVVALVQAFEDMSNGGVADSDAHPKIKVFGASRALVDVRPNDNVVETSDLTKNPLGVKGFALGDLTGVAAGLTLRQPIVLRGLNPDFTLPTGYTGISTLEGAVEKFIKNWGKVRYLDSGVLKGKTVTSFNVTGVFTMN